MFEEVIKSWRKLDSTGKFNIIKQLEQLFDSEIIEKELNSESYLDSENIKQKPGNALDKTTHRIHCGDFLLDETINLLKDQGLCPDIVVTSPPFNAGVDYGCDFDDEKDVASYVSFLEKFCQNCDLLLKDGGRLAINLRDIRTEKGFRYPVIIPLFNFLCLNLKYTYRGMHIWYKGREESSCSWGSWKKSISPSIVDLYEYVFVFQKGTYQRGRDNLEKVEFVESVMGIWKIRPVKKIVGKDKKNILNHPCPFPIELPKRVIKLYSHVGDLVLDPFAGIMTTAIAASQSGRNSVCVELNDFYCDFGCKRFNSFCSSIFKNAVLKTLK